MVTASGSLIQRVSDQTASALHSLRRQAPPPIEAPRVGPRAIGAALIESAREQLPRISQQLTDQAGTTAHVVADRVQEAAVVGTERARQVSGRVNDEVLPTLREVALNAASAAIDMWESARERALAAAREAQEDVLPEATKRTSHGVGLARGASHAVVDRVTGTAEQARQASRHAADATVTTTRDAGATVLWSAAAAGIVYYGLLDKKRREKVNNSVKGAMGFSRDLLRDIRGGDVQF